MRQASRRLLRRHEVEGPAEEPRPARNPAHDLHRLRVGQLEGVAQFLGDVLLLRKNISVQKGEKVLFDEIRYFFYLSNRWDLSVEEIVSLANGRCDQENVIEQLKNGVNAMRMPVDDLVSNWGLHGDGGVGVESQGLVFAVGAGAGAWLGVVEDGVP